MTEIDGGSDEGQFERLFTVITDVELNLKLGINNLLIKDFKTYFYKESAVGVGLGTIHVPLSVLRDKFPDIRAAMSSLIKERGLEFYGILTNCRDTVSGVYSKEVLLYAPGVQISEKFLSFAKLLDGHDGYKLHSRLDHQEADGHAISWGVGNTNYSRKDFERVMTGYFEV